MTPSTEHIDDAVLSAFVDDQLSADDKQAVLAHLADCSACTARSDELREVASLLRGLPEVALPRDFSLGPRLLVDPPNVIRLQRWYAVARTSAASLAAVFVLLSVGALYVDTRPVSAPAAEVAAKPQNLSAPAPAAQSVPAAQGAPAAGVRAAAPAVAARASPAADAGAQQPDDQVAAATSVRALPPTPVPTAAPTAAAIPQVAPVLASSDPAAPLRLGAIAVGVFAVLMLLGALVVRHRLQQASHL